MIPILFPSTATDFSTRGLGPLSDCISCTVTEQRNGIYELEMQYPLTGLHYEDIADRSIILAIPSPYRAAQPFRVYQITRNMNGTATIYAQHLSYDLAGIPVTPFSQSSLTMALTWLKTHSAIDNPFSFSADFSSSAAFGFTAPTACRSLLGGVEGSILDVYGGEYEFDGYDVILHRQRGGDNGVTIRYGKNLTDLSQDSSTADLVTGIYPYWQNSETGDLVTCSPAVVSAPGTYDFQQVIPVDFTADFEEQPTPQQLQDRAEQYISDNSIGVPTVSTTVSFVQLEQMSGYEDLSLLERCDLCDTVTVEYPALGVSAKAKIVTVVTDVLLERYNSVEIGSVRANVAQTIGNQQTAIDNQQQEVDKINETFPSRWQQSMYELAQKITGQTDSHVIFSPMEYPAVIIIAESTDLTSAGNSALYLSSAGLAGTDDLAAALQNPSLFRTAITIDGQIIGERITGLTIEGQQIIAGVIQNAAGTVRIDLDSGDAYVPRLINVTDKGGECYGIEQGTFNLSGAKYKGIRFFRMINVAPPFESPEGDYFQVLRGSSNPYGYVRLRAINSDGNDVVIDLIGDNGAVSGSGDILQVRADSTLSIKLKLTQDGWLSVPGGIRFGPSAGVSGVGLTGGRLESGGNFVSNNGGFYAQMNGTNKAWIRADGEVHGDNLVATNAISAGVSVSARNGNFSAGVVSADYRMTQDGNTGLVQFTNNNFGIMYTGNVHFCFTRNYQGSNQTMIMLPNGANRDANNYCNWNWNGYQITNARVVSSSDARIKKYITASKEKALPIIDAIPVRQYTYKKGAPECLSEKKVRFGQIAQELYDVYPEAVVHDEDKDEWYIDKMALIDPIIKAVQELSAKVTSLESELKTWKENANAG